MMWAVALRATSREAAEQLAWAVGMENAPIVAWPDIPADETPAIVLPAASLPDLPGAIRNGAAAYAFEARERLLKLADQIELAHARIEATR